VSTRGRRGQLVKSVTVSSNDPQTPNLVLKVKGQIEVIAGFEPERLNLQNIALGKVIEKEVKIVAKDPKHFKVLEVVSDQPERVTVEPKPGEPLTYKVTIKAADKPGRFSTRVRAKTNLPAPKEIMLYIYGQVSRDLVVDHPFVFLQQAGSQQAPIVLRPLLSLSSLVKKRSPIYTVTVKSLSGKPFRITAVEDPAGAVASRLEKTEQGWKVHLVALGPAAKPRGQLLLKTDRPDQPEIKVHYSVRSLHRSGATGRRGFARRPGVVPGAKRQPLPGPSVRRPVLKLAPRLRKARPPARLKVLGGKPGEQPGGR